mmetsp:Transcript_2505/g.10926  ORF Transcript_2505/g.10926 Transcript_2505/m.10926 type:complete len:190 (+) Transcript_2505:793-1362(+)
MVYRPIWYLVQAHTEKLYQVPISGWRKFSERTISERLQSLEALDAVLCRLVGEIHRSVSVLKLGSEVWTDVEAKTKQIRAHIFAMIEAVSDADLERLNLMSVDNVPRGSEVSMADFEEIVHSNTLAVRSCVFKISSIPRWWRRNWYFGLPDLNIASTLLTLCTQTRATTRASDAKTGFQRQRRCLQESG